MKLRKEVTTVTLSRSTGLSDCLVKSKVNNLRGQIYILTSKIVLAKLFMVLMKIINNLVSTFQHQVPVGMSDLGSK